MASEPKPCLIVALCVLLALGNCRAAEASTTKGAIDNSRAELDFSGIDRFWQIHSTLSAAQEPSVQSWDGLFSTPGYALLEERERRRGALTLAFRLAYFPRLAQRTEEAGHLSEWGAYVLPHLQRIPRLRSQLDAFREKIESEGFLTSAVQRAQSLLPPGTKERFPLPAISFVFFAPDGRGYPRLIVDLLHLMQAGDRSEAFLAHELFHAYRNRIARLKLHQFGDDLLIAAIGNTADEGVADQLDKSDIPDMPHEALARRFPDPETRAYYQTYQKEFKRSGEWLQFAEKLLEEYDLHPSRIEGIGAKLHGDLPDNGRILGAFMATTIIRELGRERLVEVVGDPIAYWRAYNRAAIASVGRARPLSGAALKALGRLEKVYYEP